MKFGVKHLCENKEDHNSLPASLDVVAERSNMQASCTKNIHSTWKAYSSREKKWTEYNNVDVTGLKKIIIYRWLLFVWSLCLQSEVHVSDGPRGGDQGDHPAPSMLKNKGPKIFTPIPTGTTPLVEQKRAALHSAPPPPFLAMRAHVHCGPHPPPCWTSKHYHIELSRTTFKLAEWL